MEIQENHELWLNLVRQRAVGPVMARTRRGRPAMTKVGVALTLRMSATGHPDQLPMPTSKDGAQAVNGTRRALLPYAAEENRGSRMPLLNHQ